MVRVSERSSYRESTVVTLYQLIPILGMTQKERKGAIRIIVR